MDNYIILFKKKDTRQNINLKNFSNRLDEDQIKVNNENIKKVVMTFVGDNTTSVMEDKAEEDKSNNIAESIINKKTGNTREKYMDVSGILAED